MRSFYDLFPALAQKETLNIQVTNEALPDGIYTFHDHFCDKLACRCTNATIHVIFFDSNDHAINKQSQLHNTFGRIALSPATLYY
jgi:hypothetical protein